MHSVSKDLTPLAAPATPAAVNAPPLGPSSPYGQSPSPVHCAKAKPVGPHSSKLAWASPAGSPLAEAAAADTQEMFDVEVEAAAAQVGGWCYWWLAGRGQ